METTIVRLMENHSGILLLGGLLRILRLVNFNLWNGLLGKSFLSTKEEDSWIWSIDPSKDFSVRSIMRSVYSLGQNPPLPCILAWNNKISQVFLRVAIRVGSWSNVTLGMEDSYHFFIIL